MMTQMYVSSTTSAKGSAPAKCRAFVVELTDRLSKARGERGSSPLVEPRNVALDEKRPRGSTEHVATVRLAATFARLGKPDKMLTTRRCRAFPRRHYGRARFGSAGRAFGRCA
jgi:hypothetical protein